MLGRRFIFIHLHILTQCYNSGFRLNDDHSVTLLLLQLLIEHNIAFIALAGDLSFRDGTLHRSVLFTDVHAGVEAARAAVVLKLREVVHQPLRFDIRHIERGEARSIEHIGLVIDVKEL